MKGVFLCVSFSIRCCCRVLFIKNTPYEMNNKPELFKRKAEWSSTEDGVKRVEWKAVSSRLSCSSGDVVDTRPLHFLILFCFKNATTTAGLAEIALFTVCLFLRGGAEASEEQVQMSWRVPFQVIVDKNKYALNAGSYAALIARHFNHMRL